MPKGFISQLKCLFGWLFVLLSFGSSAYATVGEITTVIGNGVGDDAPSIDATLNSPVGAAADYYGNVYIADSDAHRIRKMTREGMISTIAGTGFPGFSGDGGVATEAQLSQPSGVVSDSVGNIYVADTLNHRIRKIDTNGVITTVAGIGTAGFSGDGAQATGAQLNSPLAVAVDSVGNIYIADTVNHRIRKITAANGLINTVAGTAIGGYSGDGAAATAARLNSPRGLAVTDSGLIYIADWGNRRIRKVVGGIISTYAGTGVAGDSGDAGLAVVAELNRPRGLSLDEFGRLYLVDELSHRVRYIDPGGSIFALAGSGGAGFLDSADANVAQFDNPVGVVAHQSGIIYVVDTNNARIRRIRTGYGVDTVVGIGTGRFAGDGAQAEFAKFNNLAGLAIDSLGNHYLVDRFNHRIRKVAPDGIVTTVAGTGVAGFNGDGGSAVAAQLNEPVSVALDSNNNIYISDGLNHRIRMIDSLGNINTIAGTGVAGYNGDGVSAVMAQLQSPTGITFDSQNNLYIADYGNARVRKVSAGLISTVIGVGTGGFSGDGGQAASAEINGVHSIVFDATDNLFLADQLNDRIRKVDLSGVITTIAGTGVGGFSGDGGLAVAAKLSSPKGLDFDASGNLYIADWMNHRVRKIALDGTITTVAGEGVQGYRGDGAAAISARINYPADVVVSKEGHLLIAGANNVVRRVEGNQAPTDILFSALSMFENSDTSAPLTVGALSSNDPNNGDTHNYSISGGADQSRFLVNAALLQFRAGIVLDYESQSSYSVDVTSTDVGGMSITKTLVISLNNTNDPLQGELVVNGVLVEHRILSADITGLSDSDGLGDFVYQWLRNGLIIPGANAADYQLMAGDVDREITLRLSYIDGLGNKEQTSTTVGWVVGDLDGDRIVDELDDDIDGDGMSNDFEIAHSLNSRYAADAVLDSDGDGRNNLDEYLVGSNPRLDDIAPIISLPPDVYVDATALITELDIGIATAVDVMDGPVLVGPSIDEFRFFPGAYVVEWSAFDAAGNRAQAEQNIYVRPMVDFMSDQIAVEGARASVVMLLNGLAPVYPVTVPYQVSGSASIGEDHNLVDGELVFAEGETRAEFSFDLLLDSLVETEETIIIRMGVPVNAVVGIQQTQQILLLEGNVAPRVNLTAEQGGIISRVLVQNSGEVIVRARVADANPNDQHSYDWSLMDNNLVDLDSLSETFSFDPQTVVPGFYTLQLVVSDGELSSDYRLLVQVVATAPVLSLGDSDGDGISDASEGFGDSDRDGIADYLDAIVLSNVLQSQRVAADQYLLETEPGLLLTLGRVAMLANDAQAGVSHNDVIQHTENPVADEEYFYAGGLYDFNIEGLLSEGASVALVLPQQHQIPINATYRKLTAAGWAEFQENDQNSLASAKGEPGYCPPPNDDIYTPGLTAGHWCVQLKVQDGGPNDADGLANHRIEDPSGLAQLRVAVETPLSSNSNKGGGGSFAGWFLFLICLLGQARSRFGLYSRRILIVGEAMQGLYSLSIKYTRK